MQANVSIDTLSDIGLARDSSCTDISAECWARDEIEAVRIGARLRTSEGRTAAYEAASTRDADGRCADLAVVVIASRAAAADGANQPDGTDAATSPPGQTTPSAPSAVHDCQEAATDLADVEFTLRTMRKLEWKRLDFGNHEVRQPRHCRKRPAVLSGLCVSPPLAAKLQRRTSAASVTAPPPARTRPSSLNNGRGDSPASIEWEVIICTDMSTTNKMMDSCPTYPDLPTSTPDSSTSASLVPAGQPSAPPGGAGASPCHSPSPAAARNVESDCAGPSTPSEQEGSLGRASSPSADALAHPDGRHPTSLFACVGASSGAVAASSGGVLASQEVQQALKTFNRIYLDMVVMEKERVADAMTKKPWLDMKARAEKQKKIKGPRPPNLNPLGKRLEQPTGAVHKRPDLRTLTKMLKQGLCVNTEKRIGEMPGIPVGQTFVYRAELAVVGMHSHWLAGIDVLRAQKSPFKKTVAISCVMSGGYSGDKDDGDVVVYTGAGGQNSSCKHITGQKMKGANEALRNNISTKSPVRLIRGRPDASTTTKKVYTYDGLYQVMRTWSEHLPEEEGSHTVFKFELRRLKGQAPLSEARVSYLRGSGTGVKKEGLICRDVSKGAEPLPIPVFNTVDKTGPPTDFEYITKSLFPSDIQPEGPLPAGCSCSRRPGWDGHCHPGKCECVRKNPNGACYVMGKGKHPQLSRADDVIYECGPQCGCPPTCGNRVTQQGLQYPVELFRTKTKGWGVRSSSYIQAGGLVCPVVGVILREEHSEALENDRYLIQLDLLETMQRGRPCDRGRRDVRSPVGRHAKVGQGASDASGVLGDVEGHTLVEYCLDGGPKSNVSRFLNHSCAPNCFLQCVMVEHGDLRLPHMALFASQNIDAGTELTWDYGYELGSVKRGEEVIEMPCHCGADECTSRMY